MEKRKGLTLTISDARLEERVNDVWPQVCSSPEAWLFSAAMREVERLEREGARLARKEARLEASRKPARPSGGQRRPLHQKQAVAIENFFFLRLKCDRPRFAEVFGLPYVDYLEAVEDGDRDVIERCFTKMPDKRPVGRPRLVREC